MLEPPTTGREDYVYILYGKSMEGKYLWDLHLDRVPPANCENVYIEVRMTP